MAYKVYYMPYHPQHADYHRATTEYGDGGKQKNLKTIQHDLLKGRQPVQVWYQPGLTSAYLTGADQVYIRGHGYPGAETILGGEHGEDVSASQVAHRLLESGLPLTFTGKLKVYSCHSAENGGTPTARPFAQRVANEMYARGYHHCSYYGYLGGIDSFPKLGPDGRTHRFVRGYVVGADGVSKMEALGRGKDARIQFRPQVQNVANVRLTLIDKIRLKFR